MAEPKTTRNEGDVDAFLESVDNERRKRDAKSVRDLMTRVTGDEAEMWGNSIVGFGSYTYRPKAGGAEREWFKVGFSPRKTALTLYIMDGFSDYRSLLERLGPHSIGKACLYIADLGQVDTKVLSEIITRSVETARDPAAD
ncbi:MAG TPA: DUF1801 domain-containing protein [Acidimicrobiia bacterium]|nr:DUF1801 domain-containing protein [Acidimicrobiia bacterium]